MGKSDSKNIWTILWIVAVIIIIAMVALVSERASAVGWGMPSTIPLVKPDAAYELDTWGANSEVYEFTPQTAPHMTCVMFMLDNSKAMGLYCFPKQD